MFSNNHLLFLRGQNMLVKTMRIRQPIWRLWQNAKEVTSLNRKAHLKITKNPQTSNKSLRNSKDSSKPICITKDSQVIQASNPLEQVSSSPITQHLTCHSLLQIEHQLAQTAPSHLHKLSQFLSMGIAPMPLLNLPNCTSKLQLHHSRPTAVASLRIVSSINIWESMKSNKGRRYLHIALSELMGSLQFFD